MLTSKTKYALRAMIDLARAAATRPGQPVVIGDIAERQSIPPRFLEAILLELRGNALVTSQRGKAGGYQLAKPASAISFADVIRAIEGPLAPTPCTSLTAYKRCADCLDEGECALRKTLQKVRDASAAILEKATLASALRGAMR
ncbi:RrF2 family transcriptional regulator [Terricaulis silvestris]|uniref:HTH-type transcriptional regulator IscR n=1 Tax=Terricaulis silvestris TaxID=2686094 RepID=A0A6I6MS28_9CAUL|nr:Rrf2 family transcriptional regulator [Terricaulis silvestris]QGZ96226.1 HTH-type transcriptional regulator IscR [Terricaulis silvestris]